MYQTLLFWIFKKFRHNVYLLQSFVFPPLEKQNVHLHQFFQMTCEPMWAINFSVFIFFTETYRLPVNKETDRYQSRWNWFEWTKKDVGCESASELVLSSTFFLCDKRNVAQTKNKTNKLLFYAYIWLEIIPVCLKEIRSEWRQKTKNCLLFARK